MMSEQSLIAIYTALTGGSEALARSVVIHLDLWQSRNRTGAAALERQGIMQTFAVVTMLILILLCGGCAHYPENARLTHGDPRGGYRFRNLANAGNSDSLQVFLAFSGGGTRAAALSYGVLEELARTEIVWEGQRWRLLDEVDYISSVSGGSFTAAYYALHGDGIFTDFESRFLDRNIQWQLTWRLFSPFKWPRLASPYFNRSDMAAELYDRYISAGATFGDLLKRNRRQIIESIRGLSRSVA